MKRLLTLLPCTYLRRVQPSGSAFLAYPRVYPSWRESLQVSALIEQNLHSMMRFRCHLFVHFLPLPPLLFFFTCDFLNFTARETCIILVFDPLQYKNFLSSTYFQPLNVLRFTVHFTACEFTVKGN